MYKIVIFLVMFGIICGLQDENQKVSYEQEKPTYASPTNYKTNFFTKNYIEYELKEIICAYCDGKGYVRKYDPDTRMYGQLVKGRGYYNDSCSNCGGTGYIYR